jgi:hypothetical protein
VNYKAIANEKKRVTHIKINDSYQKSTILPIKTPKICMEREKNIYCK